MFQPWKGDRWGLGDNALGGRRLLVLGESHYSKEFRVGDRDPGMTNWCVTEFLKGTGGELRPEARRFYAKITSLVSGRPADVLSAQDRRDIWDSLTYYNYIPRIAANEPGVAPPEAMWHGEAPLAFQDIVRRSEAEAIIVCGARLWARMPEGLPGAPSFAFEGVQRRARLYAPYDAVAAPIWHPSARRGWRAARFRPVLTFLFRPLEDQRIRNGHPLPPDAERRLEADATGSQFGAGM